MSNPTTGPVVAKIIAWGRGDHDEVLDWFKSLGCAIEPLDNGELGWSVTGVMGVRRHLLIEHIGMEVVETFGNVLAGSMWQRIYPRLAADLADALEE